MLPTLRFVVKLIYHLCMWVTDVGISKYRVPFSIGEKVSRQVRALGAAVAHMRLPEESDASQIVQVLPCMQTAERRGPWSSCSILLSAQPFPSTAQAGKEDWLGLCKVLHKPLSSEYKYYVPAVGAYLVRFFLFFLYFNQFNAFKLGTKQSWECPLYYTMPGNENKRKKNFCTFCLCASFMLYSFSWCLLSSRNFAYYSSQENKGKRKELEFLEHPHELGFMLGFPIVCLILTATGERQGGFEQLLQSYLASKRQSQR